MLYFVEKKTIKNYLRIWIEFYLNSIKLRYYLFVTMSIIFKRPQYPIFFPLKQLKKTITVC